MTIPAEFSRMSAHDAIAACKPLPARLLLQREAGTRAGRTARAKSHIWLDVLIGVVPAFVVVLATRWIGAGSTPSLIAGAATLSGWVMWAFWRRNNDPAGLFEAEKWIDFVQRRWHARKAYGDARRPPDVASVPLDDLMLLCARFFSAEGESHEFGLCKRDGFDAASEVLPAWIEFIGSAPTEREAIAFATSIARCWGIDCWLHSAASDASSTQLC